MTESTFPFDGPGEDAAPDAGSKRKLALVAVAGALVIALAGYFVVLPMLSGSSDSAAPVALKHTATAPKAPKAKAKPAAKPKAPKALPQPQTYADTDARKDPFDPLVDEPQAAAAPAAGVIAPPAGTDTGTVTPPGSTDGTGTTAAGSTSGSSASVGGQRVALVHVFTRDGKQYAQTKVGGQVYTPAVGSTFASSYKLLATSGNTATYLFGDEQFTLTEGQEVLK